MSGASTPEPPPPRGPLETLERLDWRRDGADWPNRSASRFVSTGAIDWHVQKRGRGPALLLLHGSGASTHSWRGLLPLLAKHFTVIAPDLPGHAFTRAPASALSMRGMAESVGELLRALRRRPQIAVGHSAGAAVLCRMSLDGLLDVQRIIGINAALLPLGGAAHGMFAGMARVLTWNPLVAWAVALGARTTNAVENMLRDTGSRVGPEYVRDYQRLVRSPAHARAALSMMAQWDLPSLARDLPRLATPLTLAFGDNDLFVPPSDAFRVRRLVADSTIECLDDLGHLAHEEAPEEVAALIERHARESGVL